MRRSRRRGQGQPEITVTAIASSELAGQAAADAREIVADYLTASELGMDALAAPALFRAVQRAFEPRVDAKDRADYLADLLLAMSALVQLGALHTADDDLVAARRSVRQILEAAGGIGMTF